MVAVLKCEMAAAQKKVFSHPGAWKDSEIITGRPLLVNCGAGRARTAHNKILLSFAYRRLTLGISVLEGRKYLVPMCVSVGVEWYRGEKGDMAIKREIESGHQLQGKS